MKLLYDLNKHITTLAMGTMLLMTSLYDKVFKSPTWKLIGIASFLLFAATVVASVFAMLGFAMYSRSTHKTENDPVDVGVTAFSIALVMFIMGVTCFAIFALRNL